MTHTNRMSHVIISDAPCIVFCPYGHQWEAVLRLTAYPAYRGEGRRHRNSRGRPIRQYDYQVTQRQCPVCQHQWCYWTVPPSPQG